MGILGIFLLYFVYSYLRRLGKKRRLRVDKISLTYDDILEELKKNKMKSNLKIKKNSFFDFLSKKK